MKSRNTFAGAVLAIGLSLWVLGCDKSGSGSSGQTSGAAGSTAGAQLSGLPKQAVDAAMAEIAKHWIKGPNGWTTARNSGSDFAPILYLRQIRDITIDSIEAADLSDSDKMNGVEWSGTVTFKQAPVREAGDSGIVLEGMANVNADRPRGRWSQWVDYLPEAMQVQNVKGQWQIEQDTWFLRGTVPTPADFTRAGVQP